MSEKYGWKSWSKDVDKNKITRNNGVTVWVERMGYTIGKDVRLENSLGQMKKTTPRWARNDLWRAKSREVLKANIKSVSEKKTETSKKKPFKVKVGVTKNKIGCL